MAADVPNILLVVTDQQRPDLIGALGRVAVRTPALDRLCREGTAFLRAYAACPLCTPSRASLISGQYPSRHGAWSIGTDVPDDVLSVPGLLGAGPGPRYRTAIVGKSHFRSCLREGSLEALPRSRDWDFFRSWSGPWYGFQDAWISVGHTHEPHAYAMHYGLWLHDQGVEPGAPLFFARAEHPGLARNGSWELDERYHSSRWVADQAIGYLRRHRGRSEPVLLSVNFPDPHPPFVAPHPWDRMYDSAPLPPPVRALDEQEGKPALYAATLKGTVIEQGWHDHARLPAQHARSVGALERTPDEERDWRTCMAMQSLVDHHLGRILDELDRLDLAGDTLVVYTSDHGDYMGDHYLWSKGGSHYDPAVRVPLLVRWPGVVPAGARSQALVSLVDLAPTFLSVARRPPHPLMQGIDQLPVLREPDRGLRPGLWIDHRVERGLYVNTWITERHRLSVHSLMDDACDEVELYDLVEDPGELANLAMESSSCATVTRLLTELMHERNRISGPWQERLTFA